MVKQALDNDKILHHLLKNVIKEKKLPIEARNSSGYLRYLENV